MVLYANIFHKRNERLVHIVRKKCLLYSISLQSMRASSHSLFKYSIHYYIQQIHVLRLFCLVLSRLSLSLSLLYFFRVYYSYLWNSINTQNIQSSMACRSAMAAMTLNTQTHAYSILCVCVCVFSHGGHQRSQKQSYKLPTGCGLNGMIIMSFCRCKEITIIK